MSKKAIRFLIIDDEQDLLDLVSEVVKLSGHLAFSSISGHAGVELLKKEKVDVVISDLRMPEGDGHYVLEYVKTMENKPLFVLVSGHADYSPEDAIKAGAQKFCQKPYEIDELISEIESMYSAIS